MKYLREITKNGVLSGKVSRLVHGSRAHVTIRTKRTESINPTNGAKRTLYKNACKNNSYNSYKTYKMYKTYKTWT